MTISYEADLRRVMARTFEDLAYLVPVPEGAEPGHSYAAGATVAFRGPIAGRLSLRVCSDLLRALAENMLGEEEPSKEQQRDALGEMANVICGNFLPEVAGREAIFRLEAPVLTSPAPDPAPPAACVRMALDEGCAEVRLYVDAMGGEAGA